MNTLSRGLRQRPLIIIDAKITSPNCPGCGSPRTIVFGTLDGYPARGREVEMIYQCVSAYCPFANSEFEGMFFLSDVQLRRE